jgi:hypothetical protein
MEFQDIRWKRRFANFEKVMLHLETALQITHPDFVQKAGNHPVF